MELIIKAVIIGVTGGVLTLIIKRTNPELSVLLTLSVCTVIVGMAVKVLFEVLEVLRLVELDADFSSAYAAPSSSASA